MKKLILLAVLLFSINAEATNYFRWGWEDTRPSWGVNGRATNAGAYFGGSPVGASSARDCTVAHTGSCSMKLVIIGNDSGNQQLGFDTVTEPPSYPFNIVRSSPSMYYRWWMRIEPGFSWGTGSAVMKAGRCVGTSPVRCWTTFVRKDRVSIGECDGTGGCLTNTGAANTDANVKVAYDFTAMNDGQWHEYIMMVKPNSVATCTAGTNCDAELRLWVDNVQITEATGVNLNFKLHGTAGNVEAQGWQAFMTRPYVQLGGTVSDGGTIYIDDVSTDDKYNSSIALPKPTNPVVSHLPQFLHYTVASWRSLGRFEGALL